MRYTSHKGFTLIEILVFIVVSSLLMSVMLIGINTALRSTPTIHNQWQAIRLARQCIDWYYRLREVEGYSYSGLACGATAACGTLPGFGVIATITCNPWNNDPDYKTITVNVTGLSSITMTGLIGDF